MNIFQCDHKNGEIYGRLHRKGSPVLSKEFLFRVVSCNVSTRVERLMGDFMERDEEGKKDINQM